MTPPAPASRALRLALTLEDLGREHHNQKLTDLAARVRAELAGRGPDLEEHYVHAVMDLAAAALAPWEG